jgi:hypothetical protein
MHNFRLGEWAFLLCKAKSPSLIRTSLNGYATCSFQDFDLLRKCAIKMGKTAVSISELDFEASKTEVFRLFRCKEI